MSERIKWTCPACNVTYAVPSIAGLTVCPKCMQRMISAHAASEDDEAISDAKSPSVEWNQFSPKQRNSKPVSKSSNTIGKVGCMTVLWLIGNICCFILGVVDFGAPGHIRMSPREITEVLMYFVFFIGPATYVIGLVIMALIVFITSMEKKY